MTIGDLAKVFSGRVMLTALAYDKKTKNYYSFRSVGEFPSLKYVPEYHHNEIKSLLIDGRGVMWVDFIQWFEV